MLEKRLRALEAQVCFEPVIVRLSDGSIRRIYGRDGYAMRLLAAALGSKQLAPREALHLDLIRQAVTISGPCEGLLELARAIMNSP